MGVRQEFEGELVQLKTLIIAMAAKAEKSLLTAMQALKEQNPGLAAKAIDNDHEINQLDRKLVKQPFGLLQNSSLSPPICEKSFQRFASLMISNALAIKPPTLQLQR